MFINQKPYQLHQLVALVEVTFKELFSEANLSFFAEVGGFKKYGTRYYLDLYEYGPNGEVLAKVTGIVWDGDKIDSFFLETGLDYSTIIGKTILFSGVCSFHGKYGFSVSISELSGEYELGRQLKHKKLIVKKLETQGVLLKNKNLSKPELPLHIGIISSNHSQGYTDFLSVLEQSGLVYRSSLFPCNVDGNGSAKKVTEILKEISEKQATTDINYICIVRGGGGKEGLLRQNDYDLAFAVATSEVPVCVAIGHTTDSSVLDEVARAVAKTPTDAAYLILNLYSELLEDLNSMYGSISILCKAKFDTYVHGIENIYMSITNQVTNSFNNISRTIQLRKEVICGYDPVKALSHGYALVLETDGKYLRKANLSALKSGDSLIIKIFDKKILVGIKEINSQ